MGNRGYQESRRQDRRNWGYLEYLKRTYGTTDRKAIRSATKNYTVNYWKKNVKQ